MKNKLYFLGLIMFIGTLLLLTSCQQQSTPPETKYYYEGGVLNKTTLQTIVAPYANRTDLTFNDIKAVRNSIRACEIENFASQKDVSRKDCHDFLTQHGYTPSEADKVIESVNNTGNALLFFNVKNSTTKAAYIYAEKQ